MSIPRATTPTISFTFADQTIDLTQATNVYVTFRSGMKKITKTQKLVTVVQGLFT